MHFLSERLVFPSVKEANAEGLLAVGGDLSAERLLLAYQSGIFPWFNDDALILWWSPDPRMVMFPSKVKIAKSMRKVLAGTSFRMTKNQAFEQVIEKCASAYRKEQQGTWITQKMMDAYINLFKKGYAKSYEVWQGTELVGGLYGVDLGHIFCGESMFSAVPNASKYAFIKMAQELEQDNYSLIDCQLHTPHLQSLGAELISRKKYMALLKRNN
ncbi:MAG: leucyl/phenylalanyl-tRNA--protein transferase [Croceitalea sp.]|nr:leucyl/phenylalanyl-tRNA--protein transferase [Croceitalea sp.]